MLSAHDDLKDAVQSVEADRKRHLDRAAHASSGITARSALVTWSFTSR